MLFGELVETKKWSRCPSCGHCVELVEGCPNVLADVQQSSAMNVEESFIMIDANAMVINS
ncbi:hypothetical protein AAG906_022409 [Vitis piasezkii]